MSHFSVKSSSRRSGEKKSKLKFLQRDVIRTFLFSEASDEGCLAGSTAFELTRVLHPNSFVHIC